MNCCSVFCIDIAGDFVLRLTRAGTFRENGLKLDKEGLLW